MLKAHLTRDVWDKEDTLTGTFKDDGEATRWAVNAVGFYHPVRAVIMTAVNNDRMEITFFGANDKRVGFLFISEI